MPLNEQKTHIQFIREQLTIIMTYEKEIRPRPITKVNNIVDNRVGCFQEPIIPSDCPTFDEATANYVRERLGLYL